MSGPEVTACPGCGEALTTKRPANAASPGSSVIWAHCIGCREWTWSRLAGGWEKRSEVDAPPRKPWPKGIDDPAGNLRRIGGES